MKRLDECSSFEEFAASWVDDHLEIANSTIRKDAIAATTELVRAVASGTALALLLSEHALVSSATGSRLVSERGLPGLAAHIKDALKNPQLAEVGLKMKE